MHRLTTFAVVVVLAAGLGACGKHGAKNVYTCPNQGPGVGFNSVKSGKLTVDTALPAPLWWVGDNNDTLTGGFEFELAKGLCADLGIKRVRIVNVDRKNLLAGRTSDFDLALAQIVNTGQSGVVLSTPYFTAGDGRKYSALLPKGSVNNQLVNTAITKLEKNGTLASLAKKWFKGAATPATVAP